MGGPEDSAAQWDRDDVASPKLPPTTSMTGAMHAQTVRRLVMQFVNDPAEVDEVVDEILAVCVSDFADFDRNQSESEWVRRVARRVLAGRGTPRGSEY